MRIIKFLPLLLIGLLFVTSCSKDDDFKVKLSATLINKGGSTAVEGEAKEIMYDVILSRSVDVNLKLNFDVTDPSQNKDFFMIESVVIKKGETKGMLKVKVLEKFDAYKELTENAKFTLNLKSVEGTKEVVAFDSKAYSFTISPKDDIVPLTKEQRKLLKHYEKNGMNVAKWIGRIPVKTTVVTAANGGLDIFATSQNLNYEGYVEIALSEKATEDKPILKMTKNAFGLAEYLQWVFRMETIRNTSSWYLPNDPYAPPAPLAVLKALGDEKTLKWIMKEYSFDVSVDDIELNSDKTITFVRKDGAFGTYADFLKPAEERTEKVSAVNFMYHFPLWDDLVKLAKNNTELQDHIKSGGSIYPNTYIGVSTILSDDWGEGNWIEPKGTYNDSEMTFVFNTDHTNSGGYDKVSVTLKSPY